MKAGRELDALIELTFHANDSRVNQFFYDKYIKDPQSFDEQYEKYDLKNPIPHYSTSIADAWLVVEKLTSQRWQYNIGNFINGEKFCRFFNDNKTLTGIDFETPLAICLAALKAVGVEEKG